MGMNTLGGFSGAFQGLYDAYNRWQNQRQNMEAQSAAYRQRAFESMAGLASAKEKQAAALDLAELQRGWEDERLTKELGSREKIAGMNNAANIRAAGIRQAPSPEELALIRAKAIAMLMPLYEAEEQAQGKAKREFESRGGKVGPGATLRFKTPYTPLINQMSGAGEPQKQKKTSVDDYLNSF